MFRIALLILTVLLLSSPAEARRHRVQPVQQDPIAAFFAGNNTAWATTTTTISPSRRSDAASTQYLPHPSGCPRRAFCACGASIAVFGKNIRSLWPSAAWFQFKRAAPASGHVAVRRGHVFVLRQHIQGDTWMVEDYNSGGGRSRIHPRRIAGYTIVNPHA